MSEIEQLNTFFLLPNYIPHHWQLYTKYMKIVADKKVDKIQIIQNFIKNCIIVHYEITQKQININVLELFFQQQEKKEIEFYLSELFPFMANLILKTKEIFPKSIKFFKQNCSKDQNFDNIQLLCLISNMFFCTINQQQNDKINQFVNFEKLYKGPNSEIKLKKLSAIFNFLKTEYYNRDDNKYILYQRISNYQQKDVEIFDKPQQQLTTISKYENNGYKLIYDSNKNIYSNKWNDKDIQFYECPYLIPLTIINEKLLNSECLYVIGANQINKIQDNKVQQLDQDLQKDDFMRQQSYHIFMNKFNFNDIYQKEQIQFEIFKYSKFLQGSDINVEINQLNIIDSIQKFDDKIQNDINFLLLWIGSSFNERQLQITNYHQREKLINQIKDQTYEQLIQKFQLWIQIVFDDQTKVAFSQYIDDFY